MKDSFKISPIQSQDEVSINIGAMAWGDRRIDVNSSSLLEDGKMGFKYYVLPLGRREGVR